MTWLEPVILSNSRVRLEPLHHRHEADLIEAVRDGELWRLWYTSVPAPEKMGADIDRRRGLQAEGKMLPFAVIDVATAKAVGMTTYMNVDATNKRVESVEPGGRISSTQASAFPRPRFTSRQKRLNELSTESLASSRIDSRFMAGSCASKGK